MIRRKNGRRLVSFVWIYFLYWSGILRWVRNRIATSSGILVLTLHRVLDDYEFERSDSPPGMVIRRRTYAELLAYLKMNFDVITLSGDPANWRHGGRRPRIAITFDDGWTDTLEFAYPLSESNQLPIAVFVCSGLAGLSSPFWPEGVCRAWKTALHSPEGMATFLAICAESGLTGEWRPNFSSGRDLDRLLAAVKGLAQETRNELVQRLSRLVTRQGINGATSRLESTMNWEDMKALSLAGVQIGSHTQSHEILTRLPLARAQSEVGDSKIEIEARLGVPCRMIAYPNGSWSRPVRDLVQQSGYSQAFTNAPGIWKRQTDPFAIPRVNLWEGSVTNAFGDFSAAVFEYSVFWRALTAENRRFLGQYFGSNS